MTKKKVAVRRKAKEKEATKYIARTDRNEVFGKVARGDWTYMPGMSAEAIASLVHAGYYYADGDLPDDVQVILNEMKAG